MSVINVSTNLPDRLIPQDGLLVSMAEHFDQFIMDWQMKHPSVWRDRIPKGTFSLYNGYSQKSYIYRGTLGPQAGLNGWNIIEPSRKPAGADAGNDRCTYNPQTYTWSFEATDFSGLQTSWRSPVFCVNDLKFHDAAKEQLGYIIRSGAQVTDAIKETFNREIYVKTAVDAGKFTIMAAGNGLDFIDSANSRITYNPFSLDAEGDTFISFPVALLPRISTLNWTGLDIIKQYLTDQAPDAAISSEGGMPIFGVMLDLMDFERFVTSDAALREDFRFAKPQQLISGFNMGFKVYRGYALMHDPRQMRFTMDTIDANSNVILKRVLPRRATRPGIIGSVPEANPAYITAEYGTLIMFLSDVLQILVPPTVTSLGSGTAFAPQPGFNGQWTWLNIQDEDSNPLNEKGYFFSRYEYFPKPLQYAQEAIVILYRRCTQAEQTFCAIEDREEASTSALLASAVATADFDGTNRTVTLTLVGTLTGGVGARVNVTKDDSAVFAGYIVADQDAPIYQIAWENGATNAPADETELSDTAVVQVAVV